jgi:hypothetical protein
MTDKLIELAHIRNRLATEKFDAEDMDLMIKIKNEISKMNTPFKEIVINAIDNCVQDIRANKLALATQEIQLIHNFTFYDKNKWNSEYFYKFELLNYIELVDDVKRIKRLIGLLAKLEINFSESNRV